MLASNSPRRKEIIAWGGWEFNIWPAEVDERPEPGESPSAYVLRLAESKARTVAAIAPPTALVIGADTDVVDGGAILGKPVDAKDAEAMLRLLRGHTHQVYTAIAVLCTQDDSLLTDLCVTDVPMRNYSDEEMLAYIASGDPLDKAGAYAIQHEEFDPVESLQGCFANVMGMPLCHLTRTLRKLGVSPLADVAHVCQANLSYNCPVYRRILNGEM